MTLLVPDLSGLRKVLASGLKIGTTLVRTSLNVGEGIRLQALSFDQATFSDRDEEGVVISAVTGWTTGSTITFVPTNPADADKITVLNDAQALFPICVGSVASTIGTIAGVLRESNSTALNSPFDTPITLTCKDFDYWVSVPSGSGANNGTSELTPFASFSSVPATPGLFVGYDPTINRETITCSTNGVYFRPWTKGSRAALWGSVAHNSGWTQVGATDEWKKTLGYTALNVFELVSVVLAPTVTKFIKGTVAALTAGQFGTNATEVFIYSTTDPNGRNFEIPKNDPTGTAVGISATGDGVRASQINTYFCPANGFDAAGDDVTTYGMDHSFNANDGSGGSGGSLNFREYNFIYHRNGQIRSTSGAAGDGGSRHTTSTGLRYLGTITDNEKEGIGDQRRTSISNARLFMKNNNNEYIILDEGTGAGGVHSLTSSIIVWPSTNTGSAGAVSICQSNSQGPPTVEVANVAIVWKGGASKVAIRQNNGVSTIKNVIIYGSWLRGIDFRGATDGGTMVNTNLCVNGTGTPYFNNGTPGVVAGPNSITTDPLFVDPTNDDYRLQVGSPCLATGIDVGLYLDNAGDPWASPPNMGAFT